MRTMYDAITPSNIPANAQMVAGYIDGKYAWTQADWARFPNAVKVLIACFASTNAGHVLDCEWGDATPAQCPGWVVMRRKAGADPAVYTSYGNLGQNWAIVINEFHKAGVPEPKWWIAAYPGNGPALYPNSVAHQYANPGPVDLSVVADYWPGIDTTQEVPDMDANQAAQLAYVAKYVGWALDTKDPTPFASQGEVIRRLRTLDARTAAAAPSPTADAIATATAAKVAAINADAVAAAVVAKLAGIAAPTKEDIAAAVRAELVTNPLSLH